jgi:very-short-patch-repair endonuclease
MAHWQSAVDDWFAAHHGIAAASTLERLGMSSSTMHRLAQQQRLVRVMPGVFRSAQWPTTFEQTLAAACARNDSVAIGLTTADRMWGFRGVRDREFHVLLVHGSSPEMPGIVVHRCRRIDPVDIVERPDGIRLTSPPRSLFDSADMLGFESARSVLEQILHEGMCTLATVIDTVSRLYHPNRPGSRTMRAVLDSKPKWQRALQSGLELKVLFEIERQSLPAPIAQCPVQLPDGTVIHLDFGWPQWRVGLEVDDPAWHDGAVESTRDARRGRKATIAGWTVPRITRLDVERSIGEAVGDVAAIIRRHTQ